MGKEQWYSNKDLFEMLEGFKQEVAELRVDMKETKTLIRDYNGLREDIMGLKTKIETHIVEEKKEDEIEKIHNEKFNNSRKEYWNLKNWKLAIVSVIIGLLGIMVAIKW